MVMERHFEVYNGHPVVHHEGDHDHPPVERLWDIANTIRLADLNAPPLFGIATDDSHDYHGKTPGAHPGRGWTMVRATHLTPEHIVRAVKGGDCYASSGVTLSDVRYDADHKTLEVDIEPDGEATFKTEFIGSLLGVDTASECPHRRAANQHGNRASIRPRSGECWPWPKGFGLDTRSQGGNCTCGRWSLRASRPRIPLSPASASRLGHNPSGGRLPRPGAAVEKKE